MWICRKRDWLGSDWPKPRPELPFCPRRGPSSRVCWPKNPASAWTKTAKITGFGKRTFSSCNITTCCAVWRKLRSVVRLHLIIGLTRRMNKLVAVWPLYLTLLKRHLLEQVDLYSPMKVLSTAVVLPCATFQLIWRQFYHGAIKRIYYAP